VGRTAQICSPVVMLPFTKMFRTNIISKIIRLRVRWRFRSSDTHRLFHRWQGIGSSSIDFGHSFRMHERHHFLQLMHKCPSVRGTAVGTTASARIVLLSSVYVSSDSRKRLGNAVKSLALATPCLTVLQRQGLRCCSGLKLVPQTHLTPIRSRK